MARCGGCILGLNLPDGMVYFSIYIMSVRVEYAVRISSAATLYIDHWNVFENSRHADRQTDRHTCNHQNRDSVLQTENIQAKRFPYLGTKWKALLCPRCNTFGSDVFKFRGYSI